MKQVKFPNGTRVTWLEDGVKRAGQVVAHDLDGGDPLVWQDSPTRGRHSGLECSLDAKIPEAAEGLCAWFSNEDLSLETPSALSELTPADRRAGWVKLMSGELLNAPASLADNADDAADLAAIREAIDRIGGRG